MNAALVLREARCEARRPRTYAVRVAYGLVLVFVLERAWRIVQAPGAFPTASDLADAGRRLYGDFFPVQFAVVSLFALAGGADALARELRSGTLRLLVLTPLSESGIVASKWGSTMLQAAALSLCGVPLLAACVYLGGASMQDVAGGFVATLANAGLAAACGLRGAATALTPGGAVLRGALTYLGWALVPLVLAIPTAGVALLMGPFVHPLYLAWYLGTPNPSLPMLATASSAAVALLLAARVRARTTAVLARRMKELPDPMEPLPASPPERPRALTWWPGFWRRTGVWDGSPLLWKDLFTRPAARLPADGIATLAGVAVLAWYTALLVDQGRSAGGLLAQLGVFAALAVLAGAGLFTREKEDRRLETLLSGPVPTARIAASRLLSVLMSPEAALAAAMLAFTVALNAPGMRERLALGTAVVLGLAAVYLLAAAASLRLPSFPSALAAAAGILGAAWVVVPAALPEAALFTSPGPMIRAFRSGQPWADPFLVYAAAQALASAGLATWISTRLRPIVLEGRG